MLLNVTAEACRGFFLVHCDIIYGPVCTCLSASGTFCMLQC